MKILDKEYTYKKVLIAYEAEDLLTLFKRKGKNYLSYWYNTIINQGNVYLFFHVYEKDLKLYLEGKVPLLHLIEFTSELYLVSFTKKEIKAKRIEIDQVKRENLPDQNSFYDKDLAGVD